MRYVIRNEMFLCLNDINDYENSKQYKLIII